MASFWSGKDPLRSYNWYQSLLTSLRSAWTGGREREEIVGSFFSSEDKSNNYKQWVHQFIILPRGSLGAFVGMPCGVLEAFIGSLMDF